MRVLGMVVGFLLILGMGVPLAGAQSRPTAPSPKPDERVLDFEGDVIETSFLKPDASLIEGELRKPAQSLLKVRKDFVAEIVKSAEDI